MQTPAPAPPRYPTKKMYVSLSCEAICQSDKESSPSRERLSNPNSGPHHANPYAYAAVDLSLPTGFERAGKGSLSTRIRTGTTSAKSHSTRSGRQPNTRLSEHVREIAVRFSREDAPSTDEPNNCERHQKKTRGPILLGAPCRKCPSRARFSITRRSDFLPNASVFACKNTRLKLGNLRQDSREAKRMRAVADVRIASSMVLPAATAPFGSRIIRLIALQLAVCAVTAEQGRWGVRTGSRSVGLAALQYKLGAGTLWGT